MGIDDQSLRFAGGPRGFLLIHGLGGTPLEMRYVAQGLARAGYTVHVPQLAGHCRSAEELEATSWQHWYKSVEDEHRTSKGVRNIFVPYFDFKICSPYTFINL